MKQIELKKLTKSLQRDCSKDAVQEVLNNYNIKGIKEEINSNIVLLDSDNNEHFNIACSNNDSFYLLHGDYSDFSYIKKCQIKEEPNIKLDEDGYKEKYITEINYTEYEDQILGVVVREEKFIEDPELKERLINCSMAIRRTKNSNYILPHKLVDEKIPGLSIHMYDYNNWSDPILKEWYIENFVEYFTNNNLDLKLRSMLKNKGKVLTKKKKD